MRKILGILDVKKIKDAIKYIANKVWGNIKKRKEKILRRIKYMIHNYKCYRKFKNISKRKENQGYVDWKKWVCHEVEDYNEEKMENLIKRCEIKAKKANVNSGITIGSLIIQLVTLMIALLPIVISVLTNSLNSRLNLFDYSGNSKEVQELRKIARATLEEMDKISIDFIMKYIVYVSVCLLVAYLVDMFFSARRSNERIYREELLLVLKENAEEKKKA